MQVSLGDQLGLSAAQLQRQVWGESEQVQRKGGLRILVIDDEEALADYIESWMYNVGYEAEAVYTGEAGVERALRNDYGLIFMDLNLPGINGLEATWRILAERPSSRIVLMTGAGLADAHSAEIEATPFTTVLLKPFTAQEIEALLERLESGDEAGRDQVLPQSESLEIGRAHV